MGPTRLAATHLVAGLGRKHGGPSYSVPRLCAALRERGAAVRLLTVRESDTGGDPTIDAFRQDWAGVPVLQGLRASEALRGALDRAAVDSEVLHAHGLWLMPNVYAGQAAKRARRPLVVSPRGMLAVEALRFSRWKKRLFWLLLQKRAYADAACWHATSDAEGDEIRAFGLRAPIAIIPNGIDIPDARSRVREPGAPRTILSLGRVHPKKGLPSLIAAWSRIAADRPDWRLAIVGPDEGGHREELKALVERLGAPRVEFGDAVYGAAKDRVLADADLFVLATRNENFGLAVAEALAAGVPAIVTKGAPWSGLETERCGWWVEPDVEALAAALCTATALPDAVRDDMGARGRAWMVRDFGWDGIAEKMIALYRWVAGVGPRPDFVRTC